MNEKSNELKSAYRISLVIGLAMLASVAVYAVIVELMKRQGGFTSQPPPEETVSLLRYIFLGVAGMDLILILVLKRLMLGRKISESPPAAPPSKAAAPFPGVYQMKGFNYPAPILALLTSSLISYALCEAPAILGLVLFFIGRKPSDFYLFLALSLVLFAVFFPRFSQWEDFIKQREVDAMIAQGKI